MVYRRTIEPRCEPDHTPFAEKWGARLRVFYVRPGSAGLRSDAGRSATTAPYSGSCLSHSAKEEPDRTLDFLLEGERPYLADPMGAYDFTWLWRELGDLLIDACADRQSAGGCAEPGRRIRDRQSASRGPCHPPLDEGLIIVAERATPARKPSVKIKIASTIRALPSPCRFCSLFVVVLYSCRRT